jgi:hypothetical protein
MVGIWSEESHVEDWVQAKKRRNVERKIIFTQSLIDGVWTIPEWEKLLTGLCKALFL